MCVCIVCVCMCVSCIKCVYCGYAGKTDHIRANGRLMCRESGRLMVCVYVWFVYVCVRHVSSVSTVGMQARQIISGPTEG